MRRKLHFHEELIKQQRGCNKLLATLRAVDRHLSSYADLAEPSLRLTTPSVGGSDARTVSPNEKDRYSSISRRITLSLSTRTTRQSVEDRRIPFRIMAIKLE